MCIMWLCILCLLQFINHCLLYLWVFQSIFIYMEQVDYISRLEIWTRRLIICLTWCDDYDGTDDSIIIYLQSEWTVTMNITCDGHHLISQTFNWAYEWTVTNGNTNAWIRSLHAKLVYLFICLPIDVRLILVSRPCALSTVLVMHSLFFLLFYIYIHSWCAYLLICWLLIIVSVWYPDRDNPLSTSNVCLYTLSA